MLIDQNVHLGPKMLGFSNNVLWKIRVVVLSKDTIALATLDAMKQEALVVVFGGH